MSEGIPGTHVGGHDPTSDMYDAAGDAKVNG